MQLAESPEQHESIERPAQATDPRLRAAMEELQASDARYAALVACAAHSVLHIDAVEGVVGDTAWRAFTGQMEAEMRGTGWLEALHEDDRARVAETWRTAFAAHENRESEFRVRGRDGLFRTIHARLVNVPADSAGHEVWLAIHTDITDRVRAEQARERAEQFNRRIIESTTDCVKVLDLEGRLVYLNPRGQELLGICDLSSFLHRPWVDFWEDPWKQMAGNAVVQARSGGRAAFQAFCRTFDGTPKWWDVAVTPIVDDDGTIKELLAISRDITAHKEALDALHAAELNSAEMRNQLSRVGRVTLLGTLTASIAHELKQPLTAVMMNATAAQRMLDQPVPDIGEAIAALDDIVRDDRRASEIIERYSVLLKRGAAAKAAADLNAAILEVVTMLRSDAKQRNIAVELDLAEAVTVWADRVQLQQVLLNLLNNAFDAVSAPLARARAVTIRTRHEDSATTVSVDDQGPPITEDGIKWLREPFYTTRPDGLGLGLSICREILIAHGSALRVARKATGGVVFSFTLKHSPE